MSVSASQPVLAKGVWVGNLLVNRTTRTDFEIGAKKYLGHNLQFLFKLK